MADVSTVLAGGGCPFRPSGQACPNRQRGIPQRMGIVCVARFPGNRATRAEACKVLLISHLRGRFAFDASFHTSLRAMLTEAKLNKEQVEGMEADDDTLL